MEDELIALLEEEKEKFYCIAYTYVKNREDALDILHNAIVKAIQKVDSLREKRFLKTWFYRILVNESISFLRKNRKLVSLDELPYDPPQPRGVDRDDCLSLYQALDRLPPKLKTVVSYVHLPCSIACHVGINAAGAGIVKKELL